MSNTKEPQEGKELSLVEKLELRIALADSEFKLQTLLNTYLCPLLLKLLSPHKQVRNKVISICQHINTRLNSPSIQLPTQELLKQFKEHDSALLRHFDLLYISKGLTRSRAVQRLELVPLICSGIAKNYTESSANAAVLFNLFLHCLHSLELPPRDSKEDSALRQKSGLDKVEDAEFVSQWIGKLILFSHPAQQLNSPGLSSGDSQFLEVSGDYSAWDPKRGGLALIETKIVALKYIASGAFVGAERLIPLLFASADSNSRISSLGDNGIKKILPTTSLEDEKLITQLFDYFLGRGTPDVILPARPALQGKILGLLSRSCEAANRKDKIMLVIKAGLMNAPSTVPGYGPQKRGLEASKLRVQLFNFVHWVSKNALIDTLKETASTIVSNLRRYVSEQGWPQPEDRLKSDIMEMTSRSYCYESIGLLARSYPDLLTDTDLKLLSWLLQSLACDSSGSEIAISIEGALSSTLTSFTIQQHKQLTKPLEDLLLIYSRSEPHGEDIEGHKIVRSTCYVAVKYANRCLPFSNAVARYINIFALNNSGGRKEIAEESARGLDPFWHRNLNSHALFSSEMESQAGGSYNLPKADDLINALFATSSLELPSHSLPAAVVFCRNILFNEALKTHGRAPIVDANWEKNLLALVENDEESRYLLCQGLDEYKRWPRSPVLHLFHAAFRAFTEVKTSEGLKAGNCLVELSTFGPSWLFQEAICNLETLMPSLYSNDVASRIVSAHILGLASANEPHLSSDIVKILTYCTEKACSWRTSIGHAVIEVHGSVIAMAYILTRLKHSSWSSQIETINDTTSTIIFEMLYESRDKDILNSALIALDQLCLHGIIRVDTVPKNYDIIKRLRALSKDSNEQAVKTLGHLAMQYPASEEKDSDSMRIIEALFGLHDQRQPELQFAVGSALATIAAGWDSKAMVGTLDRQEGLPPPHEERRNLLDFVISKVLEYSMQTKPSLRQASAIWLLCLVQYCGHLQVVKDQLRTLQKAFKNFLSDRESLTQETASRGLSLVYEKGDEIVKEELIKDLVGSFTSSTSNLSGKVTEDTQLFEPGALPTSEKGSVTTYKDIVHLASEVGDPSLVYRFMSLASSSSIWSSRAAFGRFGLSRILSDSSVDGYLSCNPKLYSALFRYKFDPNANVRAAMNEIWSALVKDTNAAVEAHFHEIMEDLLQNILAKEWRTREASCAALGELLQGRPFYKYERYLMTIWAVTFKVCDDIKETVRRAAMALAKVLTGNLIRTFEDGAPSTNATDKMLGQVLPFLLSPSGIESSAEEVRAFAFSTLLEIIKKANSISLRPFIGEMVGDRLLPALSSLEPEAVNYVHLNADKYGFTEQQIDDIRLNTTRLSPIMEAIERCIDMLDEGSIEDLFFKLENAVRTVIGLPSKIGVSRTLVSLSTKKSHLFKPYADRFLRALRRQVLDRNDTISVSSATACGYICRLASDEEILNHLEYAKKLYFESETEKNRSIAGELVLAFAKYATDRLKGLSSEVLPFMFVAMHDTNEDTRAVFKKTWEEGMGGTRTINLYLKEIAFLITMHLESQKWPIKHASAYAVAEIIEKLGNPIPMNESKVVWPLLEKALKSKTWDGKERILKAFIQFVRHSKQFRGEDGMSSQFQKIMLREIKRNNQGTYRQQATESLGEFVDMFPQRHWFDEVYDAISPIVESLLDDSDGMDIDSSTSKLSSKAIHEATLANAARTLLKSVNPSASSARGNIRALIRKKIIDLLSELEKECISCMNIVEAASKGGSSPAISSAVLEGETSLFGKLATTPGPELNDETLLVFLETLKIHKPASESVRVKAANALGHFATAVRFNPRVSKAVKELLDDMLTDRSVVVQDAVKKACLR